MKLIAAVFIAFLFLLVLQSCKPVINKMAFHPDKKDVFAADELPPGVKEIFIETEDGIQLQTYFIKKPSSDKLLIYFHGNAGNISHRLNDLLQISKFGTNVLGVSYRGYGKSDGTPSEDGIYHDGKAALAYGTQRLGFPINNIIIFGRSIGTTAAIHTAQHIDIAGLILITPLTSGKDMAKASGLGFVSFLAGDAFNNIDRIENIRCSVLVIHGTEDNVIPFEMGRKLYGMVKTEKQFVAIKGAGHNDLSTNNDKAYWVPIHQYIAK